MAEKKPKAKKVSTAKKRTKLSQKRLNSDISIRCFVIWSGSGRSLFRCFFLRVSTRLQNALFLLSLWIISKQDIGAAFAAWIAFTLK